MYIPHATKRVLDLHITKLFVRSSLDFLQKLSLLRYNSRHDFLEGWLRRCSIEAFGIPY